MGITKNDLDLIYANWLVYSDGYLLATTVSWLTSDVYIGETAGLCIGQNSNNPSNYLSCWSTKRVTNSTFEDNKSYLIDPTVVTNSTFNATNFASLNA